MIDSDRQINTNLKHWSIELVSGKKLVIYLHFESPLEVSQDDADQLLFHIRMSRWSTPDSKRSLLELVVKTKIVARQVLSKTEVAIVSGAGVATKAAVGTSITLSSATSFAMKSSLKSLWDALDSMQVVVQMPLMKNIKYPANSMIFNENLLDIVNLDLIPTEWLEEAIYKVRETEAFNLNFEACGIETNLFITNVGFAIWNAKLYIFATILSLTCIHKNRIWKKFGRKIFWNGLIRLYLSVYQDFALYSILNIDTSEFQTTFPSESYSYILSIVILVLVLIIPILILVFLYRNFDRWQDQKFREIYGTLLDGKKTKSKWIVIVHLMLFFLRRLVFVLTVIKLGDFLWAQIALQLSFALISMIFIQQAQPFERPYDNRK